MGLLTKIKQLKTTEKLVDRFTPPISAGAPLKADILRYRYLAGPNIGGLFLNERWIDDELFAPESGEGGSELAALESWGPTPDLDELKRKWEAHWESFITEDDWKFLVSKDVTCVRLPIGFWNLPDPQKHTQNTPFAKYASVYANSWKYVVKFVDTAASHGITVLLDVHVLQGGVHEDTASGSEFSEEHLLKRRHLRAQAVTSLVETARLSSHLPNVVAVQLVNEASFAQTGLKEFYKEVVSKIDFKLTDTYLQVVISDAWDSHKWGEFDNLILDSHVYRPPNSRYTQMTAEEHIRSALNCVRPVRNQDVIVGEWEPVLDAKALESVRGDVLDLQVQYGLNLLTCFERLSGNFFWTYKFGKNQDGGVCDFRTMSEKGVFVPKLKPEKVNASAQQAAHDAALKRLRANWQEHNPSSEFEEWRFTEGFKRGWEDSVAFAQVNGSRIGRLNAWQKLRHHQHVVKHSSSSKDWVFNSGLVSAVAAYVEAAS